MVKAPVSPEEQIVKLSILMTYDIETLSVYLFCYVPAFSGF